MPLGITQPYSVRFPTRGTRFESPHNGSRGRVFLPRSRPPHHSSLAFERSGASVQIPHLRVFRKGAPFFSTELDGVDGPRSFLVPSPDRRTRGRIEVHAPPIRPLFLAKCLPRLDPIAAITSNAIGRPQWLTRQDSSENEALYCRGRPKGFDGGPSPATSGKVTARARGAPNFPRRRRRPSRLALESKRGISTTRKNPMS